jgi:glucan phosphoethanolaminetransferase (alkaline phosphatase superfamily)
MLKVIRHLVNEIVIWYTLPLLFLAIYVGQHHNPFQAVTQHLHAITLIALTALLLRTLIHQLVRRQVALALSVLLYASVLFALALYYCLVIVGLKSWGRVVTEELIVSYVLQAPQLLETLNIPSVVAVLGLTIGFMIFVMGCYFVLKKYSYLSRIKIDRIQPVLLNALLLCLALFTAFYLRDYFLSPNLSAKEPFHLSFFSGKSNSASHKVHSDTLLDKLEDASKANYKITEKSQRKNVVMIIVDALRPDHMGLYGYARDTTPYLSSLAKQGKLINLTNVRGSCGESACGLASIASSKYSHQLPSKPFTLQQVLQLQGYQINMILGGDHTNFYNLKSMYGKVDSYFDGSMTKNYYMNDDRLVVDRAKELPAWTGTPTMFQFHLMSTHTLGKRLENFEKFQPSKVYAGITEGAPRQEYINYYDNGVLQADATIRELLSLLEAKNYLKDSLIVITADHGESLGEHNSIGHGNSVREELLRVPLLLLNFANDSKPPLEVNQFVSQVDIAPTILHEMGMAIPEYWYGRPVQVIDPVAKKAAFTFFQMHTEVGLYDHRQPNEIWKYWINIFSNQEYAFNISADPKESNNLISKVPITLRSEWHKLAYSMRLQETQ